jgi:hypothetical protein
MENGRMSKMIMERNWVPDALVVAPVDQKDPAIAGTMSFPTFNADGEMQAAVVEVREKPTLSSL